jgi:hypothetical protein
MDNRNVTEDEILAGFTSLKQTMLTGFEETRLQFARVDQQFAELRADVTSEIGGLRNQMNRRFDRIEDRLDDHERRLRNLEAR